MIKNLLIKLLTYLVGTTEEDKFWQKAAEDAIYAANSSREERMETIRWASEMIRQRDEALVLLNDIAEESENNYITNVHLEMASGIVLKYGN